MDNCYLALDISLSNTGYSVFKGRNFIEIGSIPTTHKDKLEIRLNKIFEKIYEITQNYKFDRVYIEEAYIHQGRAMSTMQIIRALKTVYFALGKGGVDFSSIVELHNKTVKMQLTGDGGANKKFVQKCVSRKLNNYKFKNFDESDSVAVMFTGLEIEGVI